MVWTQQLSLLPLAYEILPSPMSLPSLEWCHWKFGKSKSPAGILNKTCFCFKYLYILLKKMFIRTLYCTGNKSLLWFIVLLESSTVESRISLFNLLIIMFRVCLYSFMFFYFFGKLWLLQLFKVILFFCLVWTVIRMNCSDRFLWSCGFCGKIISSSWDFC